MSGMIKPRAAAYADGAGWTIESSAHLAHPARPAAADLRTRDLSKHCLVRAREVLSRDWPLEQVALA